MECRDTWIWKASTHHAAVVQLQDEGWPPAPSGAAAAAALPRLRQLGLKGLHHLGQQEGAGAEVVILRIQGAAGA